MSASMTKRHFILAARMVRAVLAGEWTNEFPDWADRIVSNHDILGIEVSNGLGNISVNYTRAVWTAEAFILLFAQDNPRFNRETFLRACGLVEAK